MAGTGDGEGKVTGPSGVGEDIETGLGPYEDGRGVATEVAAGVAAKVSVGVSGSAMGGVGTSLAWLAGTGEGEGEGKVTGLSEAGEGLEGQRPQVAAQ